MNIIKWLLTKKTKEEPMSDQSVLTAENAAQIAEVVTSPAATPVAPAGIISTTAASPLAEFNARVADFVAFVEHGVNVLGAEAEADLVALKDKYF